MGDQQKTWEISSKDIIDKTGISRATLNNYIKMGILPRPLVRRADPSQGGAKKIGYFPIDVLNRINAVKRLKQGGESMESIAARFVAGTVREKEPALSLERAGGQGDVVSGPVSQSRTALDSLADLHLPAQVFLSVAAINLHDSTRLGAELPPDEFFELNHDLFHRVEAVLRGHEGVLVKKSLTRGMAFFVDRPPGSGARRAIACGLDLKAMVKEFGREWRVRKDRLHDLRLDIGIDEGSVFLGFTGPRFREDLVALGDPVETAGLLADLLGHGAVWATKGVVGRLDSGARDGIRFGVRRLERGQWMFVGNSFARLTDMEEVEGVDLGRYSDLGRLPVTEITGRLEKIPG